MNNDGYIKFHCDWIKAAPIPAGKLKENNKWRNRLHDHGLIGVHDDGTGFGNISVRLDDNNFIITGSATGNVEKLNGNHYTLVTDYDFGKNSLTCKGPIRASSESLSHAAVYECSSKINAVIHVHSLQMWSKLLNEIPTTNKRASYGTPEMAFEIKRLFRESDAAEKKTIAMGGHKEGIISFGRDLEEAGNILFGEL